MSKEGASLVPHDIPKYQHIYPKEYEVYTQQAIDLLQTKYELQFPNATCHIHVAYKV